MIVVFYAFSRELAALKRRIETRVPLDAAGLKGFYGRLGGIEVSAVATGIGVTRAREVAQRTFASLQAVELAISTGVAGALSEGLRPGDLVLADRFVVDPASIAGGADLREDAERLRSVHDALRARAVRFSTGCLLTSSRALATAEQKRRAKSDLGAIAVDMESGVLASEARSRGVPFVCVRAILDTVDDELLGAEVTDEEGRVQPLKAAGFMLRHPAAILTLSRIARNLGVASKSIADAVEAIVRHNR